MRSTSCSTPEARHEPRPDRRAHHRADGLHAGDPRRLRGHLEGAGDAAHAADVRRQLDPRDRPGRRDAHRRRSEGRRQPGPLPHRRRVRHDERRRRLRGHGSHAPDVQEAPRGSQARGGRGRVGGLGVTTLQIIEILVRIAWLAGAVAFVLGLVRMNSPATARNGNLLSAGGMAVAIAATAILIAARQVLDPASFGIRASSWAIIIAGVVIGGGLGLYTARNVKMTAMPQLVSLFNAVGGGAAALIAIDDYLHLIGGGQLRLDTHVFIVLDIIIGSITFTGSLIASGKLQGLIPGKPILIPGGRIVTVALAAVPVVAAATRVGTGTVRLP